MPFGVFPLLEYVYSCTYSFAYCFAYVQSCFEFVIVANHMKFISISVQIAQSFFNKCQKNAELEKGGGEEKKKKEPFREPRGEIGYSAIRTLAQVQFHVPLFGNRVSALLFLLSLTQDALRLDVVSFISVHLFGLVWFGLFVCLFVCLVCCLVCLVC